MNSIVAAPPSRGRHKRVSSSSSQRSKYLILTSTKPDKCDTHCRATGATVKQCDLQLKGTIVRGQWAGNGGGGRGSELVAQQCGLRSADLAQASWLWCAPSMRIIGKAVPDQRNCRRSTHSTHAVVFAHLPFMRPLILAPPPQTQKRQHAQPVLQIICTRQH